jgi:hypothetical protein
MKILIIENNRGALDVLILALQTAYTGTSILPAPGNMISQWSEARTLLGKEASDDPEQIIFCDLALDTDDAGDARAGLEHVRSLFAIKPKATWIAYTSFTEIVALDEARALFHGILNKQELSQYRHPDKQSAFVERVVRRALAKRNGEKGVKYLVEDSLGMRTFFATFPDLVLDELAAIVCLEWEDVEIRALSAGYSGSSLLALRGQKAGAPKHIVVKIAPRIQLIERESTVLAEYFGESGDFVQKCARAHEVKTLPEHLGYYSLQGAISGPTLAALFQDEAGDSVLVGRRDAGLRLLIDIELAQCALGWEDATGEAARRVLRMGLSAIDRHRAKRTCRDLPQMAEVIAEQGGWPREWPAPSVLFSRIERIVDRWDTLLSEVTPLRWVLQHGDLNPNNVILDDAGQVTFIDLARLDHWPVGYDLCRLIIQLRIRFIDHTRGLDWLQNNIFAWRKESLFRLMGGATTSLDSPCPPASLCEERLYSWMNGQAEANRLIEGARLCAVFDLIRIISYADLSPYKRLWAALEIWELTELLGWQNMLDV